MKHSKSDLQDLPVKTISAKCHAFFEKASYQKGHAKNPSNLMIDGGCGVFMGGFF